MDNNNQEYINFLYAHENNPIRLVLKNGFSYFTSNLKVIGDAVSFTDIKDNQMMICVSEIAQIMEDKKNVC